MSKYKIEDTSIEEKETFIHIDNYDRTVALYTTDKKILRRMKLKIGEPTKVFPPVSKETDLTKTIISGAEWKYKYEDNNTRDKIKQIFSVSNLLPRKKDSSN
jgi:hypothetical protein